MSMPDSPPPYNEMFGGQVVSVPAIDRLVPKTSIDHLLSEGERQKAHQERTEFEAVGREMFLSKENAYPLFYEDARKRITSGVSPDEIRAEMLMFEEMPDPPFTSIIREAYADVIAGRPPRFLSPF